MNVEPTSSHLIDVRTINMPIRFEKEAELDIRSAPEIPKWFAQELLSIGGTTDNGRDPVYRVVWGGTETHWAYGQIRLKYPDSWKTVPVAWEVVKDGKVSRIPVDDIDLPENKGLIGNIIYAKKVKGKEFWYLEQWVPPEIACEGWELYRYSQDKKIDILGPEPRQGLYKGIMPLQDNNGKFMPLDRDTLEWIRKVVYLKNSDPWLYDLRKRPPQRIVEQRIREKMLEIEEAEEKKVQELTEIYTSALMPMKHHITHHNPNKGRGY